ncbi:MAG: hypothetical protein WD404_04690 [Solirubrobacterales bacterium]
MIELFHVIPTQQQATGQPPIQPGAVVNLEAPPGVYAPGASEEMVRLFPGGITRHGRRYLTEPSSDPKLWPSWTAELFVEAVRRAEFPGACSRMESIFGFEAIEDARAFIESHRGGQPCAIYRIRGELAHRGNMSLLQVNGRPGVTAFSAARSYWRGDQGAASTLWESLLRPPVEFVEIVEAIVR